MIIPVPTTIKAIKPHKFLLRSAIFCAASRAWKRNTNPAAGGMERADLNARPVSINAAQ
jgi:hypothetical protein